MPGPHLRFNPLERLEPRLLLDGTATFDTVGGVLTIDGTDQADTIIVRKGDANGKVILEGAADAMSNSAFTGVQRIVLRGAAGDDTLVIDYPTKASRRVVDTTGQPIEASILGGDGNDTIEATAGLDTIDGGPGNDLITGRDARDSILGGAGNDTLHGDAGNDVLDGGADDDLIEDNADNNSILGGLGNDTIQTGRGLDTISAGEGDAVILDAGGEIRVTTGAGAFADITLGVGNAILSLASTASNVRSKSGNLFLTSGTGNDTINAGAGIHSITTGAGNDLLTATFTAGAGSTFNLGDGDDAASLRAAKGGKDLFIPTVEVQGGNGIDNLSLDIARSKATFGSVRIFGGADNDTIHASLIKKKDPPGNCEVHGEAGNDTLDVRSAGNTVVNGGDGDDRIEHFFNGVTKNLGLLALNLNGGLGADTINASIGFKRGIQPIITLHGNEGVDLLRLIRRNGSDADATVNLHGDDGDDQLLGSAFSETFTGGNNNDSVVAGPGDDTADGGDGDDTFVAGSGNDTPTNFEV